jgi:hypothetical protein
MSEYAYTLEITAYDSDILGTRTLYFCTGKGFCSKPSDTPANTHFKPCVIEPGNYSQFLVNSLVTDGASRIGAGEIILSNIDGSLDDILDYGLDGRELVIRYGRPGDAYPTDWETKLTGTMEQVELDTKTLKILLRDRQGEIADKVYQATKYAGSNTGTIGAAGETGVEGSADDIKGKPKPRLLGKVRNISPPLVNAGKLTFQVSDKQINSLDGVYVGGYAITVGASHASLALLQAATPGAGTYDYYLGSGSDGAYFRLGTAPDNVVTCDATQGAAASNRTAAQIFKQILLDQGIASGDINATAITAVDTANSSVIGIWSGIEDLRVGDILDQVISSIGGYWTISGTGEFIIGRLIAPTGTANRTIKQYEILGSDQPVERLRSKASDKGLPAWRVVFNYQPNYTVQVGGDVVAAVAKERRNRLAAPWLSVVSEDSAVKTKFLLSPEKQAYSLIDSASDAATEAARLQVLYGTRRDFLRLAMATDQLAGVDMQIGLVWELVYDRYGLDAGKKFILTGVTQMFGMNRTILELWG